MLVTRGLWMRDGQDAFRSNKKRAAAWRTHPLVQVPRVPVAVDGVDFQPKHAGRVRTIDETVNACIATIRCDLVHGKLQRRWTRDMIDDHQACVAVDRAAESRADIVSPTEWKRYVHHHRLAAKAFTLRLHRLTNSVVPMV